MMNKFGGFGGGANMQSLMKQAQKMQEDAARAQKEIDDSEVEGTCAGGMVKIKIKGNKLPVQITIDKNVVSSEDVEMLEDLILAAMLDANKKADEFAAKKLGPMAGLGGIKF